MVRERVHDSLAEEKAHDMQHTPMQEPVRPQEMVPYVSESVVALGFEVAWMRLFWEEDPVFWVQYFGSPHLVLFFSPFQSAPEQSSYSNKDGTCSSSPSLPPLASLLSPCCLSYPSCLHLHMPDMAFEMSPWSWEIPLHSSTAAARRKKCDCWAQV